MRPIALICLAAGAALCAEAPSAPLDGRWTLGVQRLAPDLTGSAFIQDGSAISSFDLQQDLNLGKDGTSIGFLAGYEGPRFLVEVSSGGQSYEGQSILTRPVTVKGTTYTAGARLLSHVKLTTAELTWVIKVLRWDQAYVGVDLGANLWKLKVDATGTTLATPPLVQSAEDDLAAPILQVGASAGAHLFNGHMDLRGSHHLLKKGDASYRHTLLEARAYFLRWLGVRVFHEIERVDIPKDSLNGDFALNLDRKGTGFGVVLRF